MKGRRRKKIFTNWGLKRERTRTHFGQEKGPNSIKKTKKEREWEEPKQGGWKQKHAWENPNCFRRNSGERGQ